LEENVQRTRIQKLRERIASLEQKVIKVKEAEELDQQSSRSDSVETSWVFSHFKLS
jgi:hypothetical protein